MTTTGSGRRATSYSDGTVDTFAVPFAIMHPTDLYVALLATAADPLSGGTPLTNGIDYTISGDYRASEANIILTDAAASAGKYVRRERVTSRAQSANFVPGVPPPADTIEAAFDRGAMVDEEQQDLLDRTVQVPIGDSGFTLPSAADRAGAFQAYDAEGSPIMSSGTGADAGLRQDLAAADGAQLVLADDGRSLGRHIKETPRRQNWGKNIPTRSHRYALEQLALLPSRVVGFAAVHALNPLGTTGGAGYGVYYVNDPSLETDRENTFGWAWAQTVAGGGGQIIFASGNFMPIILSERIQALGVNNVTMFAPAGNVAFFCPRIEGILNIQGNNHIYCNIDFRPMAGPINATAIGEPESSARTLVQLHSELCNRHAYLNCGWQHPSWHCLDISRTTATDGSNPCYVSVQHARLLNAIQGHLIGTNNASLDPADYTDDDSVREIFVTFYRCAWLYNLQRNPRVMGNAFVDMVECFQILVPYEVEYVDNGGTTYPEIHTDIFGGAVQAGGWLRVRGSLFMSGHPLADGAYATHLQASTFSGEIGRIDVVDSAAENLIFETRDGNLIDAVPYVLPHSAIPDAGAEREAWVKQLLSEIGPMPDAAPEGLFLPVTDSTTIPDGVFVTLDMDQRGDNTRQLHRVDPPREVALPTSGLQVKPTSTPRGNTRIVGRDEGKGSGALIDAATLDITGITSSYFSITGNGGAANLRHVVSDNDIEFADGLELELFGSSSTAVTIKSAIGYTLTVASVAADTVTVTGHGETASGFPVVITNSGGVMPGGLAASQRYYARVIDANTLTIHPTRVDAIADTNRIDITDNGTGTHTATIGSFNLPGGHDVKLDSSSRVVRFKLNSSNSRFHPVVDPANVDSGQYTPTLTNVANASALTLYRADYSRVGKRVSVTVSFTGSITTTATLTKIGVSLPVAKDLTDAKELGGSCRTNSTSAPAHGFVQADATNDRAEVTITPGGPNGQGFAMHADFTYYLP